MSTSGPAFGQVTPPVLPTPDTLATVYVWSYTWPAGRQDSVAHQLRMAGGGFLVYNVAYTWTPGEGVRTQVDWVATPLKRVRSVAFTVQAHGRDGRLVDRKHGGGEDELVVAVPLAASTLPVRGGTLFAPLLYGPDVTCIRFTKVFVWYADGTIRTFQRRKLRGFFSEAVPNTCLAQGPPVRPPPLPVVVKGDLK